MATNKTNRSIHLSQDSTPTNTTQPNTQPNAEPAEIMPVRAHVYRSMAEMNQALEQAIQNLDTLVKISYFSSESLRGTLSLLSQTRAQANRELISILVERETANARYFQQLCRGPEAVAR
jgi:hypothetical protein